MLLKCGWQNPSVWVLNICTRQIQACGAAMPQDVLFLLQDLTSSCDGREEMPASGSASETIALPAAAATAVWTSDRRFQYLDPRLVPCSAALIGDASGHLWEI